jgi:hypothetical protein
MSNTSFRSVGGLLRTNDMNLSSHSMFHLSSGFGLHRQNHQSGSASVFGTFSSQLSARDGCGPTHGHTRSSTTRMKPSPVFKSRPVEYHILVSGLWRIQSWLKRGLRVSALQNDRPWRFIFLVPSDDVSFELQRLEGDTAGRMGCTNMY